MTNINGFFEFFISRKEEIGKLLFQHMEITLFAVGLAILIGVPIGLLICRNEKVARSILFIVGIFQTIPSLAFFGFIIPILGIGLKPAIFVLFLYGLLPIVTNTYIGIKNIDKSILEAGTGMGMSTWDIVRRIEFPLAVPVIMGGIKISTVTNIGTATIAALIGAGGLGEAIFRGISVNNNYLILCGAIPAALLAIVANYILGNVEKALKPLESASQKEERKKGVLISKGAGVLLFVFLIFMGVSKFKDMGKETLVIGHKNYTEQRILGQMYGLLLKDKTDYNIEIVELGGGRIPFEALKNNDIDMYPEYTGTIYSGILKESGLNDSNLVYNYVKKEMDKKFDLALLDKLKFSNTYAFILKPEVAEKYGIKNISDLTNVADRLLLGGDSEFYEREDGLIGLEKTYGIKFKNKIHMDTGLVFMAVNSNKVDIAVAYSTDGGINKYKLTIVNDDKSFFPPYNIVPVVRNNFKNKNPKLIEIMNTFSGKITEDEMQRMNYLVTEENMREEDVAREFLQSKGYIK